MGYDIFLSYRRADQELARTLVAALEARGVGVWWDQKIDGGVDWRDAIVENLIDSDMLVILFSEECNASKQLKKELALADDMDKDVIPVLIEDTKPKGHFLYEMAARNWIQIHPHPENKINELADRLTSLAEATPDGLSGTPVPAPVETNTSPIPESIQDTVTTSTDPMQAPSTIDALPELTTAPQVPPQPVPIAKKPIDPNDLKARRAALKREEAAILAAEKKLQKDANNKSAAAVKRGAKKKKYRNFLPFKLIDFVFMLPIAYFVIEETGGGIDRIDLTDIPELTELTAMIAVSLAAVGALVFPIRYYMRNLRMKEAAKEYAKSSLALYALLWAAGITYALIEGDIGEVAGVCLGFGGLWLAFGVGAFALYGLMHFQRSVRNFNKNVDKI